MGFGKNHVNPATSSGARRWDDLTDSVQWAIDKGIAQKDKVAIMGGATADMPRLPA